MKNHQPQIVIGTPGRIADLVSAGALDIHQAHEFVVDEADMTLDMGFLAQVDQIAGALPEELQMMVFFRPQSQRNCDHFYVNIWIILLLKRFQ